MIVDANILVAAVLGRSLPLMQDVAGRGIPLAIPLHQLREVHAVLARMIAEPDLDYAAKMEELARLVDPIEPAGYADFEDAARARLGQRGQPDWPVLAAALATELPIWSNDRDLFGTGVPVWSTPNIRHVAARREEP